MKVYHEAPISIFTEVQKLTDGDYALVHLLEKNKRYRQLFQQAVAMGRDVILDNSLYELQEKFDDELFVHWVKRLRPTWYIVPDVWKDSRETQKAFFTFIEKYPDTALPGKRIGVAQGLGYTDLVQCYKAIEPYCDMVAFNFDGSAWFRKRHPNTHTDVPKCIQMSEGRFSLLRQMLAEGVFNTSKPHHLLGCGVPQEVGRYPNKVYPFIRSIDTSNPVVHGMAGIEYSPEGELSTKLSLKLCDLVNHTVSNKEWGTIKTNIERFRRCANE